MTGEILRGIMIPLIGTTAGAGCVFVFKKDFPAAIGRALNGFAAGVMVAASVWSLLIPAIERSEGLGGLSFLPATVGFLLGIGFLLALDRVIPHLHRRSSEPEGPGVALARTPMLFFAVTLHNLPEGMAVGVLYASRLSGGGVTAAEALALSIGIALQNFPEGAILSLPFRAEGKSRGRAFAYGALSGVIEPIGAAATLLLTAMIVPLLPYFLAFAAGAMLYVVVEELVPEMASGDVSSDVGTVFFAVGFSLMMALDVALG